jgi:hypothetical protein
MADNSAAHGEDLEARARGRFGRLSRAEERLVRAAPKDSAGENFAVCGPSFDDKDLANDPASAYDWDSDREIRAELIRWLCVDEKASKRVDPRGVRVYGAKIVGKLDLSYVTVPFSLFLFHCRLIDGVDLHYVKMPVLGLRGSSTESLDAWGADVRGSVSLSDGFSAAEEVRLHEAQIGGSLECEGGKFKSLILQSATIKDTFFWYSVRDVGSACLDLTNASVGSIQDDETSWPNQGNLFMDGFVYGRFTSGLTDARTRLDWLGRQKEFTPQPYRQLAKVLREMGDYGGSKQVLFELETRARAEDRRRLVQSPVRWFLRSSGDAVSHATVGYGIYPGRAIWYLGGLTALGWVVHRRAQRVGAMAPTDKDAYSEFHDIGRKTPARCQPFNPLMYSVENCIPLVKLGQDERWQPDPNPQRCVPPIEQGKFKRAFDSFLDFLAPDWATTPGALRWLRWIMIGLGWLLATFFVAALTGIIKTG